ncbi:MAG: hypothetical protein WD011_05385, partial [Nitriliruptoraceae bacterium]
MRSTWRAVSAVITVVLLAGCRVGAVAEATVETDGSGTAGWTITLDADARAVGGDHLADELVAGFADVDDAPWQMADTVEADGRRVLRVWRATRDASDVTAAFDELTQGLAADDPALRIDLDTTSDGRLQTFAGTAAFTLPEDAGIAIDGAPVGPVGEAFISRVGEFVDARLRLTVDGEVREHDADQRDGATLVWDLRPGEDRAVHLTFASAR